MTEAQAKTAAKLTAICPHFVVLDVKTAAEYYRDVLGFKILGYFLDPPVFAMVARDAAEIHFAKLDEGMSPAPNSLRRRGLGVDAYLWVTDLDALCAELKERGAKILEGPVLRVYNCVEMEIEDLYGFRLVFAMDYQHPNG